MAATPEQIAAAEAAADRMMDAVAAQREADRQLGEAMADAIGAAADVARGRA